MKFKKQALLLILVSLAWNFSVNAQDKIYRNNGKVINSKIIEIGLDEIKYKDFDNPDGPTQSIDIDRISKIKFENGRVQIIQQENQSKYDKEMYVGQRENIIKFNFFKPIWGYTELSYEKNTHVGQSYEAAIGIIGLGKSRAVGYDMITNKTVYAEQRGVYASFGYRFSYMPSFISKRQRMAHLMNGYYVKPNLYLGYYSTNIERYDLQTGMSEIYRKKVTYGSLQIELGRQWIFNDRFALDAYLGVGYCIDNYYSKKDDTQNDYFDAALNYSVLRVTSSPGVALSFGLKAGYLFNMPKKAD